MTLRIGEVVMDVAQVTPDHVFLRNPIVLPPSDAELLISIDGHETRTFVRLPEGVSLNSPSVPTVAIKA